MAPSSESNSYLLREPEGISTKTTGSISDSLRGAAHPASAEPPAAEISRSCLRDVSETSRRRPLADWGRRREASGVERSVNGRPKAVVKVVAKSAKLGVATGRFVLRPARAALREPIVREGVSSAARTASAGARTRVETATADVLAAPEAARAVDLVLASPLPEAVGRALGEHHVVERV